MSNPNLDVYIFAGLSGGTGSGCFLDACYIVQKALEDMGRAQSANVMGFFFLPDVVNSKPQVASQPAAVKYYSSNGYAAMKELDYLMSLKDDADRFWEMLDPDANGVGADGLVRDQDGFAIRVYDRYSDRATPVTRLCPHCHNPLPLPNYGKYPTIFISVVGITTCGKTVYLNQLLTRLAMAMQNTGYYITENNLPDFKENVEANMPRMTASCAVLWR